MREVGVAAAASSGRFEGLPPYTGWPQGADVLRQRLPHFLDLVRVEVMLVVCRVLSNTSRPVALMSILP